MSERGPKRPRRKAKQDRARRTLEVILEAAARVVVERGYASASTNRIAETAGVSVGTVYEYFANKDEIFEALIETEIARLVGALQEPAESESIVETLTGMIVAGISSMRHGPELYRALEQVGDASLRRRLATARREVTAHVVRLFEARRSELRVVDLERAAFVAVGAVEGVASNASRESLDERLVVELSDLLRGYLVGSSAN